MPDSGSASGIYVWMKKIDLPLAAVGTNRYELIFEPSSRPRHTPRQQPG